ncbi:hypothetical protein WG66_012467 [Moniliophthora roreri]|nr:hypothetical protein WG66_012467 [Moniliophthora roreri]
MTNLHDNLASIETAITNFDALAHTYTHTRPTPDPDIFQFQLDGKLKKTFKKLIILGILLESSGTHG